MANCPQCKLPMVFSTLTMCPPCQDLGIVMATCERLGVDFYGTLARDWGVPRTVAERRVLRTMYGKDAYPDETDVRD